MVIKNKTILCVIGLGMIALLSSCGGSKAPDEFLVLKNRPLVMPPDFYLSPEGPNANLNEVMDPQEIAKRALFGEN